MNFLSFLINTCCFKKICFFLLKIMNSTKTLKIRSYKEIKDVTTEINKNNNNKKISNCACIICYEDLLERSSIVINCGHTFHINCLNMWFQKNLCGRCPLCNVECIKYTILYGKCGDKTEENDDDDSNSSNIKFMCQICKKHLDANNSATICCGHIFHDICIKKYTKYKRTCPTCDSTVSCSVKTYFI